MTPKLTSFAAPMGPQGPLRDPGGASVPWDGPAGLTA